VLGCKENWQGISANVFEYYKKQEYAWMISWERFDVSITPPNSDVQGSVL